VLSKEARYVRLADDQNAINRLDYPQRDLVQHGT
jgi:hypothetical protein